MTHRGLCVVEVLGGRCKLPSRAPNDAPTSGFVKLRVASMDWSMGEAKLS
jgi:hypothetical protein